jgi:hypothetical protein
MANPMAAKILKFILSPRFGVMPLISSDGCERIEHLEFSSEFSLSNAFYFSALA